MVMVVVVQVTRLVMLDITHMCRRPVSLLDTDIVSRLVATMSRTMCHLPSPRVRRVVQTVSRPPHPPTLYPDLAACVARKQAAFSLPEADIPASLTRPAAEILCRSGAWLPVIVLQCSGAGEGRGSWTRGSSSPEMPG